MVGALIYKLPSSLEPPSFSHSTILRPLFLLCHSLLACLLRFLSRLFGVVVSVPEKGTKKKRKRSFHFDRWSLKTQKRSGIIQLPYSDWINRSNGVSSYCNHSLDLLHLLTIGKS